MKRTISKAAVLGSGVMGSRIACHFANIGVQTLLLDIVPRELSDAEKAAGLSPESPAVRNRIVNEALQFALKSNPSPVYAKSVASLITTGNFEDNMKDIAGCDWVIEVVVENLDIKRKVFEQVEQYRTPGTLITSNTSGIPLHTMAEGRSDDFRKYFCGTHFFNPPRYLRLLEIIPAPDTAPDVVDFLMQYGDRSLGKTTVLCKDTPAFIANRVGVYSIMALFHIVEKMGLTVEEVDKLTGPVLGRPKSATFRTCDVVGLDTLVHVANGVAANCRDDEAKEVFRIPGFVAKMVEKGWLGSKSGQGFYKKEKGEKGKGDILSLELASMEYVGRRKAAFATLEATRAIDDLRQRMKMLLGGKDKAGDFYRSSFYGLFSYVSHRIPEISDEIYRIDDAMNAGFGWELGPFEAWDAVGVESTVAAMEAAGVKAAAWVRDMLAAGNKCFYRTEDGVRQYYDVAAKAYKPVPGTENFIILDTIRANKKIWSNAGASVFDIGDGVLNLEFHTKMNTMGGEVIEGINRAIDLAEKEHRGLVIGNQGANFSAGANLAMVFMLAIEQEYDEIDFAIRLFQKTMMRVRYSSVPVVVAPHGLALGGGCEIALHADKVQAAAETYTGLVELGAGLIPGGGGTKEFAVRASDAYPDGGDPVPVLKERFLTIGMAKVSTSAQEAFGLGYYVKGRDGISVNIRRHLAGAKSAVLELAEAGYTQPTERSDILVLGKSALGVFYAGANSMMSGHYISEYDQFISQKLAYVICGGDLSQPARVSEQYLLDLEREAFLSLCGEKKTMERMESLLKTGKPLRN